MREAALTLLCLFKVLSVSLCVFVQTERSVFSQCLAYCLDICPEAEILLACEEGFILFTIKDCILAPKEAWSFLLLYPASASLPGSMRRAQVLESAGGWGQICLL